MNYVVYFSDGGSPKAGLSPTVDIYIKVSDGSSAGTAPTVSELSGGFYKFAATPTENILIRVDSEDTDMADIDRYKVMQITQFDGFFEADMSDSVTFTENTFADLLRKLVWVLIQEYVIDSDGDFIVKDLSDAQAGTGTYTESSGTKTRSKVTWD
jgi:hypothetical protein